MPRSAIHKQNVRQDLVQTGRELFARQGLKATSIQELTQAVSIAQGSFYSHFESKEELFFEILELEEAAIAARIIERLHARELTRVHLKSVIEWALEELRNNPILQTVLDPGEYKRLLRKVPAERLQSHLKNEQNLLAELVAGFQAEGLIRAIEPDELAGLFHALFVMTLHQDEIGAELFTRVLDRLTGLVADHIATQGERTVQL
jgi:AcrR family transcriptional regulator